MFPHCTRARKMMHESLYLVYIMFALVFLNTQVLFAPLVIRWKIEELMYREHKAYYVVADVCKAIVLTASVLTPSWNTCLVALVRAYAYNENVNDVWEQYNGTIRLFVILYCATDLCQFLFVKMQRSTFLHHLATSAIGAVVCLPPTHLPLTGFFMQIVILYGLFSSYAGSVNLYKALRVVFPYNRAMHALRLVAAVSYGLSLWLNWGVQLLMLFQDRTTHVLLRLAYFLFVCKVFVLDDVKLFLFLSRTPTVQQTCCT